MLQVTSECKLSELESALSRAIQRQGGSILAVTHLGQILDTGDDSLVFTLCYQNLYKALLAADLRFSTFLPMRLSACEQAGEVKLEALLPREFCAFIGRPDLERLAGPLETMVKELVDEVSHRRKLAAHSGNPHSQHTLGATEEQMNVRGSIPQRIDCKGTKVEDLAGVGAHDSSGG